ncbi:MAG: hypothetical protein J6V70_08300 [Kiritimatiellae bacterium]|nr:hypothetical protein [Kiritimatiellia bacterium]
MRDYSCDKEFIERFKNATIDIAKMKMDEVEEGRKTIKMVIETGPRISTGGGFSGFFLWDTAFCCLWARHTEDGLFPALSSLDNFYKVSETSGFINREYTAEGEPFWGEEHPISFAPPLLTWAELELYKTGKSDLERIKRVFPRLLTHHNLCKERFQLPNGLYFGDGLGSGMDDISRWPTHFTEEEYSKDGIPLEEKHMTSAKSIETWNCWLKGIAKRYYWNKQAVWIDFSSQMAFDALNLAEMADIVGDIEKAQELRTEHKELAAKINDYCWNEKEGWYFDTYEGGHILRYHIASVWVLIAQVAPPERAKRVIQKLKDTEYFNRPIPFPALAKVDPEYDPENGYWRGAVWPSTNYMAIHGLLKYGEKEFAEDVARRYYNACAALWEITGTVWENISCEQCDHIKGWTGSNFCGWGALAPIALPKDFGW